ncbi:deoxyribose-phosphate aldolase [Thermosediminibacter litoriperuensis]|uniref:Deoxyribose-phosphate aldolase n=1 Tax=Thermosediminibacter litoriperuensis TaxID=291989 RepID=A0A5S5ANM8_9FIRM|nr:deoxyribose-phosphate aldolase [Thermosediminibacter litoriperuensis]TYP53263.1 deoxyribose-phosphate aldolase [Thermosediminibacter litoriperuensis]
MVTREQLARLIDHTLLKPTATLEDIDRLCGEAKDYGFYLVCVNPCYVGYAVERLEGSDVKVGATVGFPLGAALPEVKAYEARKAVESGASEVDMVMNIGFLKSGDYYAVREDIEGVVRAVKEVNPEAIVKVILEMCYLTESEKVTALKLCQEAKADFVKTSTGFGSGGATVEDVRLMAKMVGDTMGVKASGGIRDLKTALQMIEAGANRIGTSSGVAIIEELK